MFCPAMTENVLLINTQNTSLFIPGRTTCDMNWCQHDRNGPTRGDISCTSTGRSASENKCLVAGKRN